LQQVTGCNKDTIDESCIQQCEKKSFLAYDRGRTAANFKKTNLLIKKTKGNYHSIYNETNFLNTDIATDIPDVFSSFFIDLSNTETGTKINKDKLKIVTLFENHLKGAPNSADELRQNIHPTTHNQYQLGI
jgi:putative protease